MSVTTISTSWTAGHTMMSCRLKSCFYMLVRRASTARRMRSWEVHSYGGSEKLTLSDKSMTPVVSSPSDVLVKVHASSVNPIDVKMLGGYGATVLNTVRKLKGYTKGSEFPIVFGRDFSGHVVSTGRSTASHHLKPGDEVMKKPSSFSHVEAASLPYVAMTAWSALSTVGGLSSRNTPGKRVLVLGGSGGVGTFAIQLLRHWGAEVITTCSTDSVSLLDELGADVVIDYQTSDVKQELQKYNGVDVILDFAGRDQYKWTTHLLHKNGKFVTINTPLMNNADRYGLAFGTAQSLFSLAGNVFPNLGEGKFYRWALFVPNMKPLQVIHDLAQLNKIQPVIERVYPFSQLPAAYDKVGAGHNRGKIVIDMTEEVHHDTKENAT